VGIQDGDALTVTPSANLAEGDQLRRMLEHLWERLHEGADLQEAATWGEPARPERWQSCLAVPLVGLDEIIGVLAVGCDAPDVYDEQDLQLLSIVAAQIASYLTALQARRKELAQEQLARGQAEDEKRRFEVFLAMLSHELRNPLAPIANAVHLLRLQQGEDPVQQDARAVIERQLTHLTRLVDDLLEISRVTTGRIQLRQQHVLLNSIVKNAVEMSRPLISERHHELIVSLPPGPVPLQADPERLGQVVVNLLTNAAKYTEEGGRIELTVQQEGDEAVLRVRDTGIGMNPDLLPRVFDLFLQADQPLARPQGGLGIGLTLVRTLVDMHGGSVEANSAGRGQGSEFTVRLPVVVSESPQPEASPAGAAEAAAVFPLRVLMVDDNVDMARLFGRLLQRLGHEVRTAFTGREALEAAVAFRPDVVLLDIGLPDMDGYEVAEQMRQEPVLQNVVLVAMTGYGLEADRRRSQEAGFEHHLVKPADMDVLRRILAAVAESKTP
ncbi:MAG: ATP-binding protein, partial [Dehalococcoidia bacterium]